MALSAACQWSTAVELLRRLAESLRPYSVAADIANNGGTTAAETDCNTACLGDALHLCGAAQRLQLYLWSGALNNWKTPTNISRYEVRTKFLYMHARATKLYNIAPSPVSCTSVACHRRINGKVSFLEKFGTSEIRGSTGTYETQLESRRRF